MILMGGIGRTDFECSTPEGMYESLRRLPRLISPTTVICPTHDYHNQYCTTLAWEQEVNPFLREILAEPPLGKEAFLHRKPELDAAINDAENSELVCGLISGPGASANSALNVTRGDWKSFFQEHRDSWIIDVREPHEFSFALDWNELGLAQAPQNVPLTRIAGFLPELIHSLRQQQRDVIFLCRSGKRSGAAAEIARRAGVMTARHISGGIALNTATRCVSDDWSEPSYMI